MPEDNETYDMADSYCEPEASDMAVLLQANEDKILNASMKALKSGSLTPLVKEELRFTIQSRRLAAGKGELKLEEFKKPPKRKLVTDEERKRAQVRRLQNREAAQRFRQRQKDQASYLSENNYQLKWQAEQLSTEVAGITTIN
ncbi:unnamed protein product [Candidula unifasciata]|uniref:BZIP domain-containing protein n=1 Tax=Candidula unifasciata TaxID=100452 RepID=A0A8S3Z471_9EUPU|nr:unnamed protein product [Candidula unifasciata]